MKIIYVIGAVAAAAIVCAAYWAGGRVGIEKCRAKIATASYENVLAYQQEIIKTKRTVNAEANNTGTDDIRSQLRQHYTIKR